MTPFEQFMNILMTEVNFEEIEKMPKEIKNLIYIVEMKKKELLLKILDNKK